MTLTDISSGVRVLDKASLLLRALEAEPATLATLVAKTGLPRPTAHRLAIALERLDLLTRDTTGRFVLGPRLADMSVGARQSRLLPAAEPVLTRLHDLTGVSVQLHKRRGTRRVCMFAADSHQNSRDAVPIGAAFPMRYGSISQVLLAWEDPDQLYDGLQGARFNALTLSGVRRQGWAESIGDEGPGIATIAAPVRGLDDRVVAAVALSGPVSLLSRSPGRRYASRVIDAAILIGDRLSR
ncbi:IclR family transcriptional regulator [Streptomyces sp. H39-S7]|uniref:IclR family transcriptional regulator n=1 Tax=Streptomyces sp. H39-S7 TaxID=3004357 RepID=UPI0022B0239D|nr:IclR family transcriptional regulator [Streptomyces sp. H39-S7]MCZ4125412.1 IclR family transcriptional regulator [Streptomyces sp. H39-S7]